MSINVQCPGCGKSIKVKDELAGKRGKCRCGQRIEIPLPPASSTSEPPSLPDASTEQLWHMARGEDVFGPYTLSELAEYGQSGRLAANDMVQQVGTSQWVEACKVEGLFGHTANECQVEGRIEQNASQPDPAGEKVKVRSEKIAKGFSGCLSYVLTLVGLTVLWVCCSGLFPNWFGGEALPTGEIVVVRTKIAEVILKDIVNSKEIQGTITPDNDKNVLLIVRISKERSQHIGAVELTIGNSSRKSIADYTIMRTTTQSLFHSKSESVAHIWVFEIGGNADNAELSAILWESLRDQEIGGKHEKIKLKSHIVDGIKKQINVVAWTHQRE